MKHYFRVVKRSLIYNHVDLFHTWQAIATAHEGVPDMHEEVFMWAMFRDLGSLEAWKNMDGVHYMSDPLEEDELCDECMSASHRIHNLEPIEVEADVEEDEIVDAPGGRKIKTKKTVRKTVKVWRNKHTKVERGKYKTRELMKEIAVKQMPDFRFSVFH